jgi:competence protein ComEA
LELDGVVAANIGDKDAKVLATAHGAVGVDYCWAGDGSASDESYSQHPLALIDYGAGGHGGAKAPSTDARSTAAAPKMGTVDINSATAAELKMLPGVSDSDATKIIEGRPYSDKTQLVSKKVVSEPTFEKIKDHVVARQSRS